MENLHVIEKLSADGTYQFCIDNSFSLFSDKTVYLDVLIFDPQETTQAPATESNEMVVELDIKLSDMMVRWRVLIYCISLNSGYYYSFTLKSMI